MMIVLRKSWPRRAAKNKKNERKKEDGPREATPLLSVDVAFSISAEVRIWAPISFLCISEENDSLRQRRPASQ